MFRLNQLESKTLSSLTKLSDDIYSINYYNDYDLDYVISKQPTTIFKTIKVIRQVIHNNRTYRISKIPLGCSSFWYINQNNERTLARNFDYRSSPCLVLKTAPKNGYKSIAISDLNFMLYGYKHKVNKNSKRLLYSPYLSMDGMNEKGLAISVLELNDKPTKQRNGKKRINTTLFIRYILDNCCSVDEAIEKAKQFDMFSSLGYNYHFQIVDRKKSAILEYVNDKLNIIEPSNNYQAVTNFYLSESGNNKKTKGKDRYEKIVTVLDAENGKITDEKAKETLKSVSQYYKFSYKFFIRYYVDTCYSALYNLEKLELTIFKNNNEFKFSL